MQSEMLNNQGCGFRAHAPAFDPAASEAEKKRFAHPQQPGYLR
jgi:hypothetical protein